MSVAGSLSIFLARLAGGAWMVGAGFLASVTVLYLPVVILTLPWAIAMVVVGRPLRHPHWSTPRVIASLILSIGSLALIANFPDQDIRAWLVVPGIAGVASLIALACHGFDAARTQPGLTI